MSGGHDAADDLLVEIDSLTDERDRARDTAAALEAENARLQAAVEQVQALAEEWEAWYPANKRTITTADLRAALVGLGGEGEGAP